MLQEKTTDSKFLVTTAVIVTIFGVSLFWNIFGGESASTKLNQSVVKEKQSRSIASIPNVQEFRKSSELAKVSNFDLKCGTKNSNSWVVKNTFVQLKGRNCIKNQQAKIEVLNNRNGYSASVFVNSGGKYQTDFIPLDEGNNEIRIRYQGENGQTNEEAVQIQSIQN